ncbi:MAG: glucose-1-phosphate cytidylyltransferase [Oscillatoriales cyanobacterium]|nr:MAG: glucose-1-phosphate cytidylyltransferase [Oscillatoriales cyanobacterium]
MKVVILAGGLGTRLREETEFRPKPLVDVGGKPIIWHIMKTYAHYGFLDFIVCLGYKGNMIKEYFLNYEAMNNDFTICLGRQNQITYHEEHQEQDFKVTLAETGPDSMTGGRVLDFHKAHGKLATVSTVRPTSRYGILDVDNQGKVLEFTEKPQIDGWASVGFLVLHRSIFEALSGDDCFFEREPLEQLAAQGQLMAYRHEGFFFAMDTYREYKYLNELWDNREAPWKVWE